MSEIRGGGGGFGMLLGEDVVLEAEEALEEDLEGCWEEGEPA